MRAAGRNDDWFACVKRVVVFKRLFYMQAESTVYHKGRFDIIDLVVVK